MRDTNVEVVSMMLQALEKEHRWLLQSLQGPIIAFVMDMLPVSQGGREDVESVVCGWREGEGRRMRTVVCGLLHEDALQAECGSGRCVATTVVNPHATFRRRC